MALKHCRTLPVEFLLQRGDNRGMVVSRVVNTVSGEEVKNSSAVCGEQLRSGAATVRDVQTEMSSSLTHCGLTCDEYEASRDGVEASWGIGAVVLKLLYETALAFCGFHPRRAERGSNVPSYSWI